MAQLTEDEILAIRRVMEAIDPDKIEEKVAHVDKLIESEKRWGWVRDTMFNAAKWIAAVAAMFIALKAFGSELVDYLSGDKR